MDALTGKILAIFGSLDKSRLDLNELFEARGNDPDSRTAVLETLEHLVKDGLLEEARQQLLCLDASGAASMSDSIRKTKFLHALSTFSLLTNSCFLVIKSGLLHPS